MGRPRTFVDADGVRRPGWASGPGRGRMRPSPGSCRTRCRPRCSSPRPPDRSPGSSGSPASPRAACRRTSSPSSTASRSLREIISNLPIFFLALFSHREKLRHATLISLKVPRLQIQTQLRNLISRETYAN
ncbi:hypothetical protein PUN28_008639 [Cardiocondyla obscurior]|uniref:Histone H3 n=1 Tax=Cardiocondyla obscurior TaxID=286306 RepID=A0AAW2G1E2_9HYME